MGNTSSEPLYREEEEEEEEEEEDEDEDEDEEEIGEEEQSEEIIQKETAWRQKKRLYSYLSEEEEEDYTEPSEEPSPDLHHRNHNIRRYSTMARKNAKPMVHYDTGSAHSSDDDDDETEDYQRQKRKRLQQKKRAAHRREEAETERRRYHTSAATVLDSRAECESLLLDLQFDELNRILGVLDRPNDDYDITDVPNGRVGVFACSTQAIPGSRLLLDLIDRCSREVSLMQARKNKLQLQTQEAVRVEMKRRNCDYASAAAIVLKSNTMHNLRLECARVDKSLQQFQKQYTAATLRYDNLMSSAKNIHILKDEREAIEMAASVLPTPDDITAISEELRAEQERLDDSVQSMNDTRDNLALADGTDLEMTIGTEAMAELNDFLLGIDSPPPNAPAVLKKPAPTVSEERMVHAPAAPRHAPSHRTNDDVDEVEAETFRKNATEKKMKTKKKGVAVAAF